MAYDFQPLETDHFPGLKTRQRKLREDFPEDLGLRVHRALSWLGRAEAETDDADARFLFLWIAFNAAYARDLDLPGERGVWTEFFCRLDRLDPSGLIYNAIWSRFSGPIRLLMTNCYLYGPFWQHQNDPSVGTDWEVRFARDTRSFHRAVQSGDSVRLLTSLFDRLYVLRNQIMHGGATWNSAVNRDQVRDGAAILGTLVPVFVSIMMENPNENWGAPFYPVV